MQTEKDSEKRDQPQEEAAAQSDRTLGYGHKAHSPDPDAKYGFDPGPNRLLPRTEDKRWRVTG